MVCIIDDREDVWNFSPNLIHVKPYRFFQGTADINAPPGLGKTEHDSEPVKHKIVRTISRTNSSDESKTEASSSEVESQKNGKDTGQGSENSSKGSHKVDENQGNEINVCKREEKEMEVENEKGGKSESSKGESDEKEMEVEKDGSSELSVKTGDSEPKENICEASEGKENGTNSQSDQNGKGSGKENSVQVKKSEDESKSEVLESKNSDVKEKESEKSDSDRKEKKESKEVEDKMEEVEEIEWVDEDDYLMYLEDILSKIHSVFYDMYDQSKTKGKDAAVKPDLKNIIPYIKRKVLKGVNILFSGVIPTNQPQEKSRAYYVATNLGATVQREFVAKHRNADNKNATTHVVAAKLGTVKVKTAQKHKHVRLVSADWLWACAERLERCDERLYPVTSTDSPAVDTQIVKMKKRKNEEDKDDEKDSELSSKRSRVEDSQSGETDQSSSVKADGGAVERRFSTTYNPILAFSDDDIACMDREVEDLMDEEGEDSDEEDVDRDSRIRSQVWIALSHIKPTLVA